MPMGLSQALTTLGVQQLPGDKGGMRGLSLKGHFLLARNCTCVCYWLPNLMPQAVTCSLQLQKWKFQRVEMI